MYKYCNNLLPSSFNNMFKTNAENHDYNTRNALNFEYPNNKLNFCDKSISYHGVKTWNNIPNHVKSGKNLNSSLGSRREAFLSQNIRTCMCSFTFNPAFHQNSKVFSYNFGPPSDLLVLPLIYCWPSRTDH